MTPQERDLLANLVARLKQAPAAAKDDEAEATIRDLTRDQPDAPYLLAQTVLIQDYALHQAQARIAELEQQAAQPQRSSGGSFLGALFGTGAAASPAPTQAPSYAQAPPAYAPAQPAPGPWGAQAQSSAPSFLRSAATTAAGIAGGALLFQGIESLFSGGHGGFGGGGLGGFGSTGFSGPAPGLTETVINNNYYGDDANPGGVEPRDANATLPPDAVEPGVTDADYQDDFGGDDFGGGGGDDTLNI